MTTSDAQTGGHLVTEDVHGFFNNTRIRVQQPGRVAAS